MDLREENALLRRVTELEDFQMDVLGLLQKWSKRRSQTDMLPEKPGPSEGGLAHKALTTELCERYLSVVGAKYMHLGAQDAQAVKKLLTLKDELRPELLDRWERCLRMKQYPGTRSLSQFVQRIREFDLKGRVAPPPVEGDPYGA